MNTELVGTKKYLTYVFMFFLVLYPNLFVRLPLLVDSWLLPRIIFLVLPLVCAILCIKHLQLNRFFIFFLVANFILSIVTLLNPTEDSLIYNLYGENGRADGVIYQIQLLFFIIFAIFVLKNRVDFLSIFIVLSFSGFIQSVLTIIQYIQIEIPLFKAFLPYDFASVVGFMGHSGYVGGFFIPIIIANIYSLTKINFQKNQYLYYLLVFTLLINSLGLSVTQNRSSVLSALFLTLVYLILNIKNLRISILTIISAALIFWGSSIVPVGAKIPDKELGNFNTFETRLLIWNIGIQLLPQSWGFPFIGGGVGEFKRLISDKLPPKTLFYFYEKELGWKPFDQIKTLKVLSDKTTGKRDKFFFVLWKDNKVNLQNITLDKTHNFYLDKIYSIGVFGACIWAIFYLFPIYCFLRLQRFQRTLELSSIMICLLGIQIYYLLWFPMPQVEPIHVVIALMAWVGIERARAIPNPALQGFNSSTTPLPQSLEA